MESPLLTEKILFHLDSLLCWYYVDNIWFAIAHIYAAIVCGVDYKINNTSMDEQPLIAKKYLRKSDSIMFAAGLSYEEIQLFLTRSCYLIFIVK